MKVIDPGHIYELDWLDGPPGLGFSHSSNAVDESLKESRLIFVKREGELKYPGNIGHYPGTNLQEVLRACIDRVKYLDKQVHDGRNENVIKNLRHAIWYLEQRAASRHDRELEIPAGSYIENLPTCKKCGHIGCTGDCHE